MEPSEGLVPVVWKDVAAQVVVEDVAWASQSHQAHLRVMLTISGEGTGQSGPLQTTSLSETLKEVW